MFTFPTSHSASSPQVFSATVMLSGSNGGMVLSTDGGISWGDKPVNTGFDGGLVGLYLSGTTVVAYGNNGFVESSSDGGVNWTPCPIAYDGKVSCVVYDSTNSLWVASVIDRVYTSDDLVTWVYRATLSPFSQIKSMAFGGGVIVAVGTNSLVFSSSDGGVSWTQRSFTSMPSGTSVNAVYYSSVFMAVGSGGEVQKSSNGSSWTRLSSGTVNNLNAVTKHGSLWVAVGDAKTIITSSDSTAWATRVSGIGQLGAASYCSVKSNGTSLVVCASNDNDYQTSTDGVTWTKRDISVLGYTLSSGEMALFYDSLYVSGSSKWIVVGEFKNANNGFSNTKWRSLCASSSSLSSGWSQVSISGDSVRTYRSLQYDNLTDTWYAVAEGTTSLVKSSDGGDSWSIVDVRSSPLFDGTIPVGALYYNNGVFLLTLYQSGNLYRSIDGCSTWTLVANITSLGGSGAFLPYKAGGYVNGRFVIPCAGGALLHSVDGVAWSCVQVASVDLCQVAYGGGVWVVVGYGGIVRVSSNLVSWTLTSLPTSGAVSQVYYDGGWFYAYTASGQVYRSQNGTGWVLVSSMSPTLFDVGYEYAFSHSSTKGKRGFSTSTSGVYRTGDGFTFNRCALSSSFLNVFWRSVCITGVSASSALTTEDDYALNTEDENRIIALSG